MNKLINSLVKISDLQHRGFMAGFGLMDVLSLNVMLGCFLNVGIRVVAVQVEDDDVVSSFGFDPDFTNRANLYSCISEGRIFLGFDDCKQMGLITHTKEKKYLFLYRSVYRAYFNTPSGGVNVADPATDLKSAFGWVEREYKKCH